MKYLKTFESNKIIDKSYIEDLFIDLKEIFKITFDESNQNNEKYIVVKIRYNIPTIHINSIPQNFTKKDISSLDELIKIKEYSNKFESLYLELSKILKLCNCEYYLNGGENAVSITFWIKK